MDPALYTLVGAIATAVIAYVLAPWVNARLQERRDNDPALGWQKAVSNLEERVSSLEDEIERMEIELSSKTTTIARLETTTREQGKMITARDARIAQLEVVLQNATGHPAPPADPATAYWLHYTPAQGAQS